MLDIGREAIVSIVRLFVRFIADLILQPHHGDHGFGPCNVDTTRFLSAFVSCLLG